MRRGRALPAALLLTLGVLGGCTDAVEDAQPNEDGSSSRTDIDSTTPTMSAPIAAVTEIAEGSTAAGLVPGLIVVVADESGQESLAFGLSDRESGRRMRVDDRFQIASVTKSMLATVVLQLVAEKRLGLRDTVESLVPGLLAHGERIRVAHLLGHVSGLQEVDYRRLVGQRGVTDRDVVRPVADAPLEAEPGTLLAYRDVNYTVLGIVVEQVTGQRLEPLLRERIFEPLALSDTRLATEGNPGPRMVHGYEGESDFSDLDVYWFRGAGGVTSSAEDVSAFFRGLLDGSVLPAEQLAQMTDTGGDDLAGWTGYGLGLAALDTDCGVAVGHSGRLPGFVSEAWTYRREGRSVVILANSSSPSAFDTLDDIRNAALCS